MMSNMNTPPRRRSQRKPIEAEKTATSRKDAEDFNDPAHFINRELSQIEFNFRVLAQAQDERLPLLERLKYLCISCTNLDEFFEIRVAAIRHQLAFGGHGGSDGTPPGQALEHIHQRACELVEAQYAYWNGVLRPGLDKAGIRILVRDAWNAKQRRWLKQYFDTEVVPVLSPLAVDPSHPFPRILNKSLNLAVLLKGKDAFGREGGMALVRAPRSLPRIIHLPPELSGRPHDFVLLSAVLSAFVEDIFPGMQVKGAYQFRVTRNSELFVDEDEVENLAHALRDELAGRGYSHPVRLEIAEACPKALVKTLLKHFDLPENAVYRINGPVNLNRVIAVYDMVDRPELKFPAYKPRVHPPVASEDLFEHIRREDVLLHHPFDSFNVIIDLVKEASVDPNVLAIKQTLYRTGHQSPLVNALIEAARNGKDVTVVIELRARFDEEANLRLADRLQEAGVQVVYGVVGYKTHAKMLLIVRREGRVLQRYVHLGTGNYHSGTARLYTDIGLLTANAEIGDDVHLMFTQMSGLSPAIKLKRLLQSPFTLHKALLSKIKREADNARVGKPASIVAKLNAINEPQVIRALYAASCAGVQIDLIVRGACCLRPGVPGVSETIRVRSVVGRFLEHSRVYWFANDGSPELFCSSADWMERNLLRRIETCFPILDAQLAARVRDEDLSNYLADNTQAWRLETDGRYVRVTPGEDEMPHSAQQSLLALLCH